MKSLIVILSIVISVAILTLAERKLMGAMQRRVGPNQVGYLGLLQPFADGFKLILKETILPLEANNLIFLAAPFLTFYLALLNWLVIPLDSNLILIDLEPSILYILAISSLGVYGVIYSGWSANSKYTLLGSLRSTAQMISYEISFSLIILCVVYTASSINIMEIANSQSIIRFIYPLLPIFILAFISALAETNRAPFDLPEAESELVAGFMTEHSAISFTFLFLAEYTNIITISTLISLFFFGFGFYFVFLLYAFIWVRAALPRLRFDQLLRLGWVHILSFTIGFLLFLTSLLFSCDLI
jgi:NADH:ubiquinone oxidoreductase subunit H